MKIPRCAADIITVDEEMKEKNYGKISKRKRSNLINVKYIFECEPGNKSD